MASDESEHLMARRRSRNVEPPPWSHRQRLTTAGISLLFLLPGLMFVIGTATTKWRLSEKADRLRADGVYVVASVSDRRDNGSRGGATDTIRVSYIYQGVPYSERILCGGPTGCFEAPGPQMAIWVDPASPEEFVAENGNTDDSTSFFNAWGGIPFGLLLAGIGSFCLFIAVFVNRIRFDAKPRRRTGG